MANGIVATAKEQGIIVFKQLPTNSSFRGSFDGGNENGIKITFSQKSIFWETISDGIWFLSS